ncbi:AEC family transporter [Thiotrichales bacterium 19S9-12]|nr:AEC family transporter [Thiotrichales bacterium 19S9-11]MCF6812569.1 AEC family transporter [Thiotrichales bacterium 19S9-12]
MLSVFSTTFILFFTIFLGMILGRSRIFGKGSDRVLIHFVFYVALPMHLFLSCYHSKLSLFNYQYTVSYILSMLIMIGVTFFVSYRLFKTPIEASALNTMSVTQIDGAYFTIPLFILIFSNSVLAIPLMAIQNVIFFTLTVLIIELALNKNNQTNRTKLSGMFFVIKRTIKVLTTNPIIVSSILGFVLGSTNVELDHHITDIFEFLGKTSAPIALFALGISCSYNLSNMKEFKDGFLISLLVVIKLILFPVIALVIGYGFGLSHELLLALVLLCASPTATHNYIIANQYGVEARVQTFVVVLTTIFSFITINLWLYFLQ